MFMAMPTYADQYADIPYQTDGKSRAGCDCWGLCCLVFAEQYGIDLTNEADEIAAIRTGRWLAADEPREGDLLLFKTGAYDWHVGIALDSQYMLHTDKGINSRIERHTAALWRDRLKKVYRYV